MKFSLLLKHSRPRFRHYLFGPMLVLGSYFLRIWVSQEVWFIYILGLLFTTFVGNIFIYGVNDYYDGDTDSYNSKKEWYEVRLSTKLSILWWVFSIQAVFFLVAFVIWYFVFRGDFFPSLYEATIFLLQSLSIVWSFLWLMLIYFWLFYFFSRIYSAPPIRAKARPFLDGITNVLYIIIPFSFYGSTFGRAYINFFALLSTRLRCMAMHCFSAIPDIEPDSKAGITTTAVYLWKQKSLLYCIMLYAIAGILASQVIGILGSFFGLLYCGMVFLGFRYDIFRIYKRFPYINFLVGMLLCFYIYFVM